MEKVYIIGHKNPDTDSICSAYCYANLKNIVDKSKNYVAARCGNMNNQTKFIFNKFGIDAPVFLKDVYTKVTDVMTSNVFSAHENTPLYSVMKDIDNLKIRLTPIVNDENKFTGVASIFEIANFYVNKDALEKPSYYFRPDNFDKVIKGYYYKRSEYEEFSASIMVGAMPYDRYLKRMEQMNPKETVLVVGKRRDIIEYAIKEQVPAIILTGMINPEDIDIDFSSYKGWVYISQLDTAETVRKLPLTTPAKNIMSTDIQQMKPDNYLDQAKDIMMSENRRGLPVIDDNGHLIGIITRSDLIKKSETKIILMDHNELTQAVDGADISEILEVIDHHRLGTIKTKKPVFFYAKPVGSTCTLVYQLYRLNGVEIDKKIGSLLLSGILTDTVILKSPTATDEDKSAIEELSKITGINYVDYGKEIFSSSDSLKQRKPEDIINTDFKIYDEFGIKFGIGQVEVVNIEELDDVRESIIATLKNTKESKNINWAMLLVTDIICEKSILLTTEFKPAEQVIMYRQLDTTSYDLPDVLSRKKQLLPEILRVLEEIKS